MGYRKPEKNIVHKKNLRLSILLAYSKISMKFSFDSKILSKMPWDKSSEHQGRQTEIAKPFFGFVLPKYSESSLLRT